jgi:predicted nucleotidyltransferase
MSVRIDYDRDRLAEFCRKWQITELALFGSVLRDDFGPDSDVDVLVSFAPESQVSYWEWPEMIDELRLIFGRQVDLIEKDAIRNPFRRHEILHTHEVVYAA